MEELLVLGQIPFTNIRISFTVWLFLVGGVFISVGIAHLFQSKSAAIHAYVLNQKVAHLLLQRS